MKRFFIFISILVFSLNACFAFNEYDARNVANQFYKNIKIITEGHYPDGEQTEAFVLARNNLLALCYSNNINLPNEFAQFNFEANDPFLYAAVYIKRLFEFSIQKNPKIEAEITSVTALEEIKSTKSEDSKNFYEVRVKKTITVGWTKKTYQDVVRIIATNGKITEIANESGGGAGESIISLRGKAADLFSKKKYDEAFDVYLKIIQKNNQEGDAYYRLGLMAYHKLGCKHRYASGKERRKAAYNYIISAIRYGDYKISKYARHVKYYMDNGGM